MIPRVLFFDSSSRKNVSKTIRVLQPLRRLAAEGRVTAVPLSSVVAGGRSLSRLEIARMVASIDAVFVHIVDVNNSSADLWFPICDEADARGIPVIVDADDGYFVRSDVRVFDAELAPHLAVMRQACGRASVMSVTTDALADFFAPLARSVICIPNTWELRPLRPGARDITGPVHVGWAGGPTHMADLALFLPAMKVVQRRTDARFTLFGLYDQPIYQTLENVRRLTKRQRAKDHVVQSFANLEYALRGIEFEHKPGVPCEEFTDALGALAFDIGVCPLLDTPFNQLRSAIKLYQYAAVGALTVASDSGPYRGECSVLVENSKEAWIDTLVPLVEDRERRAQLLAEQREFVRQHRSWDAVRTRYMEVLLSGTAAPVPLLATADRQVAQCGVPAGV